MREEIHNQKNMLEFFSEEKRTQGTEERRVNYFALHFVDGGGAHFFH